MSRWLVTGAAGMLGRDMCLALRRHGEPVTALGHHELDVTDPAAVAARFGKHQPDVVVNCAAWTAVDAAEEQEAQALRVNGTGAANLAAACARHGAHLVQVSTDYVFAGDRPGHGAWARAGLAPIGTWDGALARAMPGLSGR